MGDGAGAVIVQLFVVVRDNVAPGEKLLPGVKNAVSMAITSSK